MKLVTSALAAIALLVASASAGPEAAPAPAPAPIPALEAGSITARAQRPREDDMDCWKCPSTNGHTLTGQSKWGKGGKEWSCQYKYDPPIWQVWKLIDKLDAGPKHCYYDGYYGEWTGRQSCSGYTCEWGCVYHMDDTCRTWQED
ncbi:hypothetical protein P389DRAFT_212143 [Cystobasidium minutum MCA 4210]|uniref:uncharacterized protein n=1 Tax=Cystobasidium minutum MCA 4210 TaxID=1397322 RepID=UPI0034CEFCA4|eukprot:jgi/Rhomi1/212143/estExt_Genemark1.C_60016